MVINSMDTLHLETVNYKGNNYIIAIIPNVFSHTTGMVSIGTESLNSVIYDDEHGYPDEEARRIDEQIYAYVDDEFFKLDKSIFIEKAKEVLD